MTPAEYHALSQPRLSHPARTLYTLFLRRLVQELQPLRIDYPYLGRGLAVSGAAGFSYQVTPRQLTELLDELVAAGLVELHSVAEGHYHHATFTLPLYNQATATPLPERAYPMRLDWRPDNVQFPALARLCGLAEAHYNEEELGEFIAYWLGRTEVFATSHQWMLKFVRMLKQGRYARRSSKPVVEQGFQQLQTPPEPSNTLSKRAQEMIAEAKRLAQAKESEDDHE